MNKNRPSNKISGGGRPRGSKKTTGSSSALDTTSYILIAFIVVLVFGGVYLATRSPAGDTGGITNTTTSLSTPIAGLTGTGKPTDAALAETGKPIFEKYCVACHGVKGIGEKPEDIYAADPSGRVVAPPLNGSAHAWHHADEDLLGFIMNGVPQNPRMIAWKNTISQEDGVALVNYIKSLWEPQYLACQGGAHMSPECQAISTAP